MINDEGSEVPENTIIVIPHSQSTQNEGNWRDIIVPLRGINKRDWFTDHFYYCLPLLIGNQYGFAIRSMRDVLFRWPGGEDAAEIIAIDENEHLQMISTHFENGVVTFQNHFSLKTPPGINLMTIQVPNSYIPGVVAMTGVVETDNIRRDFTFNLRCTIPGMNVRIRRGDAIAAFLPIQRATVEKYVVKYAEEIFPKDIVEMEQHEGARLSAERNSADKSKPHQSGRRYHQGIHINGEKYRDHQRGFGPVT